MGPSAWPGGPAASRTKAEQQERLERLAKPRAQSEPPPPQEAAKAGPPRSPRAQREACSRLAEPKKRAAKRCERQGEEEAVDGDDIDAENALWAAEAEESLNEANPVLVIPSLLTEMQGQLEPIAEDMPDPRSRRAAAAAGGGGGKSRHRARSHSVPTIAAPYAVPVVPPQPGRAGASGGAVRGHVRGHRGAEPHNPMEDDLGHFVAHALSSAEAQGLEGEAMLAHIDQLYNQVMGTQAAHGLGRASASSCAPGMEGRGAWPEGVGAGAASESSGQVWAAASQPGVCPTAARGQPPAHAGAPLQTQEEEERDEWLLANIDRLYGEMLQGGSGPVPGPYGEAPVPGAAVRAPPEGEARGERRRGQNARPAPAGGGGGGDLQTASWDEVREVLEEVLWSALLMGRGTIGRIDMQAKLLELLPSHVLRRCIHATGRRGLPPSLSQRLQTELPRVHAALAQQPSGACTAAAAAQLARTLRDARDGLLALASSEVSAGDLAGAPSSADHAATAGESAGAPLCGSEAPSKAGSPTAATADLQGSRPRRPKQRRSSLSHWTFE